MEVNNATEIRKLPAQHHAELGRILDDLDNWKNLMSKIPKKLQKENFECDIGPANLPKYVSEHYRLIEQESRKSKRSCTEILFDEWGCSGRVRPTVGHLLHLLKKSELYRAADYVAKHVLHEQVPSRPNYGPLAPVEVNTMERRILEDPTPQQDVEEILDAIDYPSSAIEEIQKNMERSSAVHHVARGVPKIVVSEISDMMKFSQVPTSKKSNSLPHLSEDLPNLTELNRSPDSNTNMPHLSDLMRTNSESSVMPSTSTAESNQSSRYLPNFDAIQTSEDLNNRYASTFLPATLASSRAESLAASKTASENSKHCSSPLPSLSLNTRLPHFTYAELEAATNNFDETPFEEPAAAVLQNRATGRFLGSGGFSSVYLSLGILNRPIAVKRINLKDLNIVKADDFVTKQFKNEVEVLYKYKHENLLSLVGYSCDGLTYCLLYEYMPGGNLEDRLEKRRQELIWTQRLHIALGTARGINYLHTAYSSPLIHRDVKSANILLDATNKPKLCDFGIMRISSSSTTETSRIYGTAAYMAPESLRGDVSVKMDVYSFGVVLLELITGLPSRGSNRSGIDLVTHIQDSLNDEEDIRPLIDTSVGPWTCNNINFANELYRIANGCLQHKKNLRPTMTDIINHLLELLRQSV